MAMRLKKQTLRDETLEHQVILFTNHDCKWGAVMVSCNCLKVPNEGKAGATPYMPMDVSNNLDDTKRIYNTPENHYKPFDVEEWGLKW